MSAIVKTRVFQRESERSLVERRAWRYEFPSFALFFRPFYPTLSFSFTLLIPFHPLPFSFYHSSSPIPFLLYCFLLYLLSSSPFLFPSTLTFHPFPIISFILRYIFILSPFLSIIPLLPHPIPPILFPPPPPFHFTVFPPLSLQPSHPTPLPSFLLSLLFPFIISLSLSFYPFSLPIPFLLYCFSLFLHLPSMPLPAFLPSHPSKSLHWARGGEAGNIWSNESVIMRLVCSVL